MSQYWIIKKKNVKKTKNQKQKANKQTRNHYREEHTVLLGLSIFAREQNLIFVRTADKSAVNSSFGNSVLKSTFLSSKNQIRPINATKQGKWN